MYMQILYVQPTRNRVWLNKIAVLIVKMVTSTKGGNGVRNHGPITKR